ncbi:pectate lyase [Streptosporangiaceae bacterium NEAU-GS5]|nr:pectate lyase [Streptosporangiaceae bacterium NEAU-GS5]
MRTKSFGTLAAATCAALIWGVLTVAGSGPAAAAPAPGAYQLVNAASGLCLDVNGASTADGTQLIQWTCSGANNQRWNLTTQGSGFRLAAVHSGKCAGVRGSSTSAGAAVEQQTCTGAANQTWTLTLVSGSTYQVVNSNGGKCLNVKDSSTATGALVQQNSCDSVTSKRWTFTPAGTVVTPTPTPTPTVTPTSNPLPGWPTATGQQAVTASIQVSGTFDGHLVRYFGSGPLGSGGQDEGQDPIFNLANGAVLRNVIMGAPAADGIHCNGTCTLQNVWWEDVGEDAATFRATSASQTMLVDGGGARSASDKVFQHNGPGTMTIRNFQVSDFGKLYRSCGNCSTQFARHVIIQNVVATMPGKVIAGINTNFGDTARFTQITIVNDAGRKMVVCDKYTGVTSGEPVHIGSGADGTNCLYSSSDITYR